MSSFSENLKAVMERKGVTNYWLSKQMGVSPTSIARWLDGNIPNAKTIIELSSIFDCSTDYLLKGYDAKEKDGSIVITQTNSQNSNVNAANGNIYIQSSPDNYCLQIKNIVDKLSEEKSQIAIDYLSRLANTRNVLSFIYDNQLRFMNRFGDLMINPYFILYLELLDNCSSEERCQLLNDNMETLRKNGHDIKSDIDLCSLFQHYNNK